MNMHEEVVCMIGDKSVKVDKGIWPILHWLNRLPGVRTLYSCQGEDSTEQRPYVVFFCDHPHCLTEIIRALRSHWKCSNENGWFPQSVIIEIDFFYPDRLRYVLRWVNTSHLKEFIEFLQGRVEGEKHV